MVDDFGNPVPFDALSDEKRHDIEVRLRATLDQLNEDLERLEKAEHVNASIMRLEFTI